MALASLVLPRFYEKLTRTEKGNNDSDYLRRSIDNEHPGEMRVIHTSCPLASTQSRDIQPHEENATRQHKKNVTSGKKLFTVGCRKKGVSIRIQK